MARIPSDLLVIHRSNEFNQTVVMQLHGTCTALKDRLCLDEEGLSQSEDRNGRSRATCPSIMTLVGMI